jgi:hypothetical protein
MRWAGYIAWMGEMRNTYQTLVIKRDAIKIMRWAGYIAWMGEMRNTYQALVIKPDAIRSLRRPRCRREVNKRF